MLFLSLQNYTFQYYNCPRNRNRLVNACILFYSLFELLKNEYGTILIWADSLWDIFGTNVPKTNIIQHKRYHGNCNIGMCNFVRIEITLSTDLYPIRSTATDMCLGCSGQLYMLLSFSTMYVYTMYTMYTHWQRKGREQVRIDCLFEISNTDMFSKAR
jgi:hypothetical protein